MVTKKELIEYARRMGGEAMVRSFEEAEERRTRVGAAFDDIVTKEIEGAQDPFALLSGLCEAACSLNARVVGMMGTSLNRPEDEVVALATNALEKQLRSTYKITKMIADGEDAEIKVPDGMAEMIAAAAARGGSDA